MAEQPLRVRGGVGALAVAWLLGPAVASPSVALAQRFRPNPVVLQTQGRDDAESLAGIATSLGGGPFSVELHPNGTRVRASGVQANAPVVVVETIGEGLRALYAGGAQRVEMLDVVRSSAGEPRVTVDRSAEEALLVIVGPRASQVAPVRAPPRFAFDLRDGPDFAVRYVGEVRPAAPIGVTVPEEHEVWLVARGSPPDLDVEVSATNIRIRGVDEHHRVDAYVDDAPLDLRPAHGGGTTGTVRGLSPGRHVLRVQAVDAATGREVARVDRTWFAPRRFPLRVRAGGRTCIVLDGETVAHRGTLATGGRSTLRVTYEPGAIDGRYLGAGTRICVWAPLWATPERLSIELSESRRREAGILDVEVQSLPAVVLYGTLPLAFLFFFSILSWVLVGRRGPRATHLGVRRDRSSAYRGGGADEWTVVELPSCSTPLSALDPVLEGCPHQIAAAGRLATVSVEHPVIVALPGHAPIEWMGRAEVGVGTQIVDGATTVWIASKADASPPPSISAEDRERARALGLTDLPPTRSPRRWPRILGAAVAAAMCTACAVVPPMILDGLGPAQRPWARTLHAWGGGLALGLAAVLLVAWLARSAVAKERRSS